MSPLLFDFITFELFILVLRTKQCLHGLRTTDGSCNITTTLFPQVTAMAATFNFDLVYDMAALLGKEARACNNVAGSKVFTKG
jgi:beta-glucosidase-like glycosyl hydrolase